MQDAKANFADACQAIDEAAGFIDNRHRLAEIQVAMLSSSRLDPSVRFVDELPGQYKVYSDSLGTQTAICICCCSAPS